MNDFFSWIAESKHAHVLTAMGGAALAVAFEFKRHTWATAILAFVSGAVVAMFATGPIIDFWSLPESYSNAIAGVLGISGRNLIVWLLQASKDPLKAWTSRK